MTIDYTKPANEIAEEIKMHIHGIGAICNYEAYECALMAVNLQLQVCPKTHHVKMGADSQLLYEVKSNHTYTKLQEVKQILTEKLK